MFEHNITCTAKLISLDKDIKNIKALEEGFRRLIQSFNMSPLDGYSFEPKYLVVGTQVITNTTGD